MSLDKHACNMLDYVTKTTTLCSPHNPGIDHIASYVLDLLLLLQVQILQRILPALDIISTKLTPFTSVIQTIDLKPIVLMALDLAVPLIIQISTKLSKMPLTTKSINIIIQSMMFLM